MSEAHGAGRTSSLPGARLWLLWVLATSAAWFAEPLLSRVYWRGVVALGAASEQPRYAYLSPGAGGEPEVAYMRLGRDGPREARARRIGTRWIETQGEPAPELAGFGPIPLAALCPSGRPCDELRPEGGGPISLTGAALAPWSHLDVPPRVGMRFGPGHWELAELPASACDDGELVHAGHSDGRIVLGRRRGESWRVEQLGDEPAFAISTVEDPRGGVTVALAGCDLRLAWIHDLELQTFARLPLPGDCRHRQVALAATTSAFHVAYTTRHFGGELRFATFDRSGNLLRDEPVATGNLGISPRALAAAEDGTLAVVYAPRHTLYSRASVRIAERRAGVWSEEVVVDVAQEQPALVFVLERLLTDRTIVPRLAHRHSGSLVAAFVAAVQWLAIRRRAPGSWLMVPGAALGRALGTFFHHRFEWMTAAGHPLPALAIGACIGLCQLPAFRRQRLALLAWPAAMAGGFAAGYLLERAIGGPVPGQGYAIAVGAATGIPIALWYARARDADAL